MFEPDILGFTTTALLPSGALVVATAGFLFLCVSRQPLTELPFGVKT